MRPDAPVADTAAADAAAAPSPPPPMGSSGGIGGSTSSSSSSSRGGGSPSKLTPPNKALPPPPDAMSDAPMPSRPPPVPTKTTAAAPPPVPHARTKPLPQVPPPVPPTEAKPDLWVASTMIAPATPPSTPPRVPPASTKPATSTSPPPPPREHDHGMVPMPPMPPPSRTKPRVHAQVFDSPRLRPVSPPTVPPAPAKPLLHALSPSVLMETGMAGPTSLRLRSSSTSQQQKGSSSTLRSPPTQTPVPKVRAMSEDDISVGRRSYHADDIDDLLNVQAPSSMWTLPKSLSVNSLFESSLSSMRMTTTRIKNTINASAIFAPFASSPPSSNAALQDPERAKSANSPDSDEDALPRMARSSSLPSSTLLSKLKGGAKAANGSEGDAGVPHTGTQSPSTLTGGGRRGQSFDRANGTAMSPRLSPVVMVDPPAVLTPEHVRAVLDAAATARVPPIIVDCCNELRRRGLTEEGIFRVPGSHSETQRLLQMYRLSSKVKLANTKNVFTIASLLKMYLRNLSTPLIPTHLSSYMERAAPSVTMRATGLDPALSGAVELAAPTPAASTTSYEGDLDLMRRAIFTLEPAVFASVRHIVQLLALVAEHVNENRMDMENIARCFAPSMFHDMHYGTAASILYTFMTQRAILFPSR